MSASYGVIWQNGGTQKAGKLELDAAAIRLEGIGDDGEGLVVELLPYRDLAGVRVARGSADRLDGRPTLVLDQANGDSLRVASVAQSGIVSELAEKLSAIKLATATGARRVAIIVPFKPECRDAVLGLVEQGPPFDPELMSLERHEVYVTEREAIFVFEGPDGTHIADRIVKQAGLWRGALVWRKYLNGKPRIAHQAYAWSHDLLD